MKSIYLQVIPRQITKTQQVAGYKNKRKTSGLVLMTLNGRLLEVVFYFYLLLCVKEIWPLLSMIAINKSG